MNKFFSAFASVFTSKNKFATETVATKDGGTITIEAVGESMAIGDKVFDSEGNAVADGEVVIVVDGQEAVIEIENGAIKEVKAVEAKEEKKPEELSEEEEKKKKEEEEKSKAVPEEFSKSIATLQAVIAEQGKKLAELTEKFSKASKVPTFGAGAAIVKTEGNITKLSKDAVQEAAKKYRK